MKIALIGDIAFFGKYSLSNNKKLSYYFEEVSTLLKEYDIVVGNLETPFVTDQKEFGHKSAHIKSDSINIELLKQLNINIVNLANNHIYDFGKNSFALTKQLLEENGIDYFGVDDKQIRLDNYNASVALHGYCCFSSNPLGTNVGVNRLDIDIVEGNLVKNHEDGYFNIVSFHYGQEHIHLPSLAHRKMANYFADICPYIFYGHHPHVIQSIERIKDSIIYYSLGNFCFDDVFTSKSQKPLISQTEDNKSGIIVEVEIEGNQLKNSRVIPVYQGKNKLEVNVTGILENIDLYSQDLLLDTIEYAKKRDSSLDQYSLNRGKQRDIKWFLKRLNFKSLFMIFEIIRNKRLFRKHFTNKLKMR